jgi:CRISPR-associated endoribonuclease Cas6
MPQKISLVIHPKQEFDVPFSEGYQLYSAILEIMNQENEAVSKHAHDSPISSLSLGPLQGKFKRSNRPNHKTFDASERYEFRIGITDPREVEIFQSIIKPLIFKERNIQLEKGELQVEEVKSTTKSFEEILTSIMEFKDPCMEFNFLSPACIQYRNSKVFEMFPHREAVFHSLLSKWNAVCPEGLKISIDRDEMARHLVEKPLAYETHSVVVNTFVDKKKGHARPKMIQGFTGRCQYTITRDMPEGVRNGIVALAMFAEYCGVGSAVARGCGAVNVTVGEVK